MQTRQTALFRADEQPGPRPHPIATSPVDTAQEGRPPRTWRPLCSKSIPEKPLDVLAQQIVAASSTEDWDENELFELARNASSYRNLSHPEFESVVTMLAEGFSTKRGRRAALVHHDAVNHRIRGRRGSGLLALTSGGAIPDTGDYRIRVGSAVDAQALRRVLDVLERR